MSNTAMESTKPNFAEVIRAIQILCQHEKAADYFAGILQQAMVGDYESLQDGMDQLIARTDNAVIAMLAAQAKKLR